VRPASLSDLKPGYRLGAGELVVDLRDIKLPAGDHPLNVDIGAGHALVLVPDDVCVASKASVGMGLVAIFNRDSGGVDVDWDDNRRAPERTPRLVVDGDVGLGFLEVRHRARENYGRDFNDDDPSERNTACSTRTADTGGSSATSG
jgi:hypothetical protein